MMINETDLEKKFDDPEELIEIISEDPYLAVAHVDIPAVIHFPRHTKTADAGGVQNLGKVADLILECSLRFVSKYLFIKCNFISNNIGCFI